MYVFIFNLNLYVIIFSLPRSIKIKCLFLIAFNKASYILLFLGFCLNQIRIESYEYG